MTGLQLHTRLQSGANASAELQAVRSSLARLHWPSFAVVPLTRRPFIVAMEGPNAAGKTTLCKALASSFGAHSCLGIDQAWFSEKFKARMIRDAHWYSSAMFFLSGCFEQMRLLRERPETMVIMDRSIWSTLAVHAAASCERLEKLLAMLRPVASEIQVPDLTIVLEASFATCQSRMSMKTGTARALDELTATAAFHAREQEFYRWLAQESPCIEFLNVDDASAKEIAAKAEKMLRGKVPC